ncbi:hypothetical protein B296_00035584, partial [Ensete ventricosum]
GTGPTSWNFVRVARNERVGANIVLFISAFGIGRAWSRGRSCCCRRYTEERPLQGFASSLRGEDATRGGGGGPSVSLSTLLRVATSVPGGSRDRFPLFDSSMMVRFSSPYSPPPHLLWFRFHVDLNGIFVCELPV